MSAVVSHYYVMIAQNDMVLEGVCYAKYRFYVAFAIISSTESIIVGNGCSILQIPQL